MVAQGRDKQVNCAYFVTILYHHGSTEAASRAANRRGRMREIAEESITKAKRVRPLGSKAGKMVDEAAMAVKRAQDIARKMKRPLTQDDFQVLLRDLLDELGEANAQLMGVPMAAVEDLKTAAAHLAETGPLKLKDGG